MLDTVTSSHKPHICSNKPQICCHASLHIRCSLLGIVKALHQTPDWRCRQPGMNMNQGMGGQPGMMGQQSYGQQPGMMGGQQNYGQQPGMMGGHQGGYNQQGG